MKASFDFLGLAIEVDGADDVVDEVRRDFSFFARPAVVPAIRMSLKKEAPPYDGLPAIPAAFSTPRNFCFRQGKVSYVDYFGRGLTIHDRSANAPAWRWERSSHWQH